MGVGYGGSERERGGQRLGWAGGENTATLVGDVSEYGTGYRGQGRGGRQSVSGRTISGTDRMVVWSWR